MTERKYVIPVHEDNPYPLGRNVEHDERSKAFAFPLLAPLQDVTTYHQMLHIWLDQKSLGACVGFSGAEMGNTAHWKPIRRQFNRSRPFYNLAGIHFYSLSTQNDQFDGQWPPEDTGSSGLGLAKALKSLGLIDRYMHTFSFTQFRAAIQSQPVIVGTAWTEDMFYPDRNGFIHVGELSDQNIVGGHEYLIRAIDYENHKVVMRNHWRRTWGIDGEAYIDLDEFGHLLMTQGDCTVLHGTGLA